MFGFIDGTCICVLRAKGGACINIGVQVNFASELKPESALLSCNALPTPYSRQSVLQFIPQEA